MKLNKLSAEIFWLDRSCLWHTSGTEIPEQLQLGQKQQGSAGIHLMALPNLGLMGVVTEWRSQGCGLGESSIPLKAVYI